MGFVQEIADLVDKARFHKIVYQFQQGLYFRAGRIRAVRKHLTTEEKHSAWAKEKGLIEEMGGYKRFLPFRKPELPDGFVRSWISGLPLHESRFTELLDAGFYFMIPFIDHIETGSTQSVAINVGTSNMLSADGTPMSASCNFNACIVNFKKAYLICHDWEHMVEVNAVSALGDNIVGKPDADFRSREKIDAIKTAILADLKALVTDKWGIEISELRISDCVPSTTIRHVTDGQTLNLTGHLKTEAVQPES